MSLSVHLDHPDFSALPADGLDWQVEKLNWRLPGGAESAALTASLPGADAQPCLQRLDEYLGRPLRVLDAQGRIFWHGWVESVSCHAGHWETRRTLQGLCNRAACRYPLEAYSAQAASLEQQWSAWRVSDWHTEANSLRRFGRFEQLDSLPMGDAHLAQQTARMRSSAAQAWPRESSLFKKNAPAQGLRVGLTARGWWQRLEHCYDQQPNGLLAHLAGGKTRQNLGKDGSTQRLAQSFHTSVELPLGQAWLRAAVVGSPPDGLQCSLCADANGSPGSLLATALLPAWQFSGGFRWLAWLFEPPCTLQADRLYWLVIERAGTINNLHSYAIESDDGPGYAAGELKRWNGSAWLSEPEDLRFCLLGVQESSSLATEVGALEFISAVKAWQPSGIWLPSWRPLEKTWRQTLENWLALGSSAGARLNAVVDAQRAVQIFSLPRDHFGPIGFSEQAGLVLPEQALPYSPDQLLGMLVQPPPASPLRPFVLHSLTYSQQSGLRVQTEL